MPSRILAIVAHPDDEVLGCGGTLAKHAAQGDEVRLIIATDGGVGIGKPDELRPAADEAARILGIRHIHRMGFKDQALDCHSLLEIIQPIEDYLMDYAPHILYAHHHGDLNRDHQLLFEATMTAARPILKASLSPNWSKPVTIPDILCFQVHSSTEWAPPFLKHAFLPNYFVDISSTLDKKLAAMARYQTEVRPWPHPRSLKAIEIAAQREGAKVSCDAVESFMVVRQLR